MSTLIEISKNRNLMLFSGGILILSLIIWIIISLSNGLWLRQPPKILGVDSGGISELHMDKNEFDTVFAESKWKMQKANKIGNFFNICEKIVRWLAFFASSSITLIAGFYGHQQKDNQKTPNNKEKNIPQKAMRIMGFLAAISAVLTASSSLLNTESNTYYEKSDHIYQLIVDYRKQILEADNAEDENNLLNRLLIEVNR